jgi:hypothetical protein
LAVLLERMYADLQTAGSVAIGARIKVAAGYFAEVSNISELVSRVIEVGYVLPTPDGSVLGFLRGDAREIATANPAEILERFQADCSTSVADALNPQGSMLPTPIDSSLFSYNSGGAVSGFMWISWTWNAFTIYKPDGTTISVPASSSLATPPTAVLSQVAGGALAGRTRFARVGYAKNLMVYHIGAEASLAVSANNLLKITSPASVAGYDGWMPLVGLTSNTEFFQPIGPVAFGTDWTEPSAGAVIAGDTPYDNTKMPAAVTARALLASTTYFFYPWWEIGAGFAVFANNGSAAKSAAEAINQSRDGRIALSATAISGLTPAAGFPGSGTAGAGKFL